MRKGRWPLFLAFLRIGLTSFGASASQAIVAELIERRKWLSEEEFEEVFSLSSLSPGPFHLNVVIHFGLLFGGVTGMLIALSAFVGPSLLLSILVVTSVDMAKMGTWLEVNRGVLPGVYAGICGLLISVIVKLGRARIRHARHGIGIVALSAALIAGSLSPFVAVLVGGLATLCRRELAALRSDRK